MHSGDKSEHGKDDHSARTTTRHDLLEPILPLPNQVLNVGTGCGSGPPGAAPADALPWHWNVLLYTFEITLRAFELCRRAKLPRQRKTAGSKSYKA